VTTQTDLASLDQQLAWAQEWQAEVAASPTAANIACMNTYLKAAKTFADALGVDLAPPVVTPPPATGPVQPSIAKTLGFNTLHLDDRFADLSNFNEFYGPGVRWDDRGADPSPDSGSNDPKTSNDVALYTDGQVALQPGGGVQLRAQSGVPAWAQALGYQWSSGCLTSKQPLPGQFVVRVRAKRSAGSGSNWDADWFLPSNSSQEFDGFEGNWPGNQPALQGHSKIFAGAAPEAVWPAGVDLSADFHNYDYLFVPGATGQVGVYLDDKQVWHEVLALVEEAYYLFLQLQIASQQTQQWHLTGGAGPFVLSYQEVQVWTL